MNPPPSTSAPTAQTMEMVTDPLSLHTALESLREKFPDIHEPIVAALQKQMEADGSMTFIVTRLAKSANVQWRKLSSYLRHGRRTGLLMLLGKRMETGEQRYCAYQPLSESSQAASCGGARR